jgi:hypothetical protein
VRASSVAGGRVPVIRVRDSVTLDTPGEASHVVQLAFLGFWFGCCLHLFPSLCLVLHVDAVPLSGLKGGNHQLVHRLSAYTFNKESGVKQRVASSSDVGDF